MPNDGIDPGFPWPVAPAGQPAAAVAPADDGKAHVWAQKGFQFHDLLDIVNPLQHLPVVSSIYRWITGDGIGNLPRVVGDALYGGPMGFVSGLLGVLVKEESGKDIGEHVIAALTGGSDSSATGSTQAAAPADPPAAAAIAADTTDPAPSAYTAAPLAAPAAPPTDTSAAPTAAAVVAPAATPAPAPPVLPDHPPIPLARTMASGIAVAPASTPTGTAKDPVAAFRSEVAQRERPLQQRPATENGRVLSSQPIPLQIPPGALSAPPVRTIKVMASPPTSSMPADSAPPSGQPIEISQKMLQALDKYMALQGSQNGVGSPRGTQLDVSP